MKTLITVWGLLLVLALFMVGCVPRGHSAESISGLVIGKTLTAPLGCDSCTRRYLRVQLPDGYWDVMVTREVYDQAKVGVSHWSFGKLIVEQYTAPVNVEGK